MKFIVATSKMHADNSALIDWGWKRSPKGYVDDAGDDVRYLSDVHHLYSLQRGSVTVYLGWHWWENHDLRGLEEICWQREYKTVTPESTASASPRALNASSSGGARA